MALGFFMKNAIRIHELGEQAFGFYADGVCNVMILLLTMYCINKRL